MVNFAMPWKMKYSPLPMCLPVLLRRKVHKLGRRLLSRWTSTSGEEHWGKYYNEHHASFCCCWFGLPDSKMQNTTAANPLEMSGRKNEWSGKTLNVTRNSVDIICFNIETFQPILITLYWKVDCFTWWRLWGQYRSRLRKPEQTLQIGQCCQWSHT